MSVDLMDHVFRSLEKHFTSATPQTRSNPGTVSASLQQKGLPTAGIGTADAGTSAIVRYWTVRYRYDGSPLWNYTQVIACDPFKASLVVMKRKREIVTAEVVREIDRDEFEHLTKVSP